MDNEEKKKNIVMGVSAAVGSTASSAVTESIIKNSTEMGDVEVVAVESQNVTDIPTDGHHDESIVTPSSTSEESVAVIVPQSENPQLEPSDIIIEPEEPVMYGGPIVDDEDLVVIDIDSDMYGGPVEDIEPMMYGGPIPDDDLEQIDIDCDIYGGPVDII